MDPVRYYLDPWSALVTAIYRAEGGTPATMIKAIQCSFPDCGSLDEALCRTAKTIRNRALAFHDFSAVPLLEAVRVKGSDPWTGEDRPRRLRVCDAFIDFLAARWAPIGVVNDPHGLNVNWSRNVRAIYAELMEDGEDETQLIV